jgi:hypothetical protein
VEQEFGREESLFVDKSEPFDLRRKSQLQGHTKYFALALIKVGNIN